MFSFANLCKFNYLSGYLDTYFIYQKLSDNWLIFIRKLIVKVLIPVILGFWNSIKVVIIETKEKTVLLL